LEFEPDAITGRTQGDKQIGKYENATGKKGRAIDVHIALYEIPKENIGDTGIPLSKKKP
jgi:hypothetical protein